MPCSCIMVLGRGHLKHGLSCPPPGLGVVDRCSSQAGSLSGPSGARLVAVLGSLFSGNIRLLIIEVSTGQNTERRQ